MRATMIENKQGPLLSELTCLLSESNVTSFSMLSLIASGKKKNPLVLYVLFKPVTIHVML